MSRLLFAAARGARIEFFAEQSHRYEWMHIERVPLKEPQAKFYRIHPDDEHLQYGPISTALREYADTGKTQYTLTAMLAMDAYNHERDFPLIFASEWHHASTFALILAEALADEGL